MKKITEILFLGSQVNKELSRSTQFCEYLLNIWGILLYLFVTLDNNFLATGSSKNAAQTL